jgi:putative hemolysin
VGCFITAAVLAMAEVSLVRVRRSEVMVAAETDRRAGRLLRLLDDLPVALNTILLFVLFTRVAAASIGTYLAQRRFGGAGVTVMTVCLSATLFVYAEALPKTIAVRSPLRIACLTLPILRPLVRVGRVLAQVLLRIGGLGSLDQQASGALTEEELLALASESATAGSITKEDAELFERTLEFGDRTVEQVMVGRDDIRFVQVDEPVSAALAYAIDRGHRRLPVVNGSIDDVSGVVRLRDLAAARDVEPEPVAGDVMGAVLHCSPDLGIEDLLSQIQATGHRLAVVDLPDPDGEGRLTVGIATIEDLVAELLGEVEDEAGITIRRRGD